MRLRLPLFALAIAVIFSGCTSILGDFDVAPGSDAGFDANVPDTSVLDASKDAPANDASPDAGETSVACDSTQKSCGGACVALDDPKFGCANVATCDPCVTKNASATCTGGACAIAQCDNGFEDCVGGASDGCETNTASDPAHCGSCTNACSATGGTPNCAGGKCSSVVCTGTHADCNQKPVDACEVDLSNDPANCGTCTNVCASVNGTGSCAGSRCSFACTAPFAHCATSGDADGCNIDTSKDDHNCGQCGTICTGGTACQNSKCDCPAGQSLCNGACVNTTSDGANCGACGHNCGGGGCSTSVCQPVQVAGGLGGSVAYLLAANNAIYGSYTDANKQGHVFVIQPTQGASTAPPTNVINNALGIGPLWADATNLWFGNNAAPNAGIFFAPFTNLASATRASNTSGSSGTVYHVSAQGGHAYWDQGTGTLFQQTGPVSAVPVVITPSAARAIGSDGQFVYFAKAAGTIYRGTGDLTQTANLQTVGTSPPNSAFDRDTLFDALNVYFGDSQNLYRYPKTGGNFTKLLSFSLPEPPEVYAIDPDPNLNRLYWAALDTDSYQAQTVWAANRDGTSTAPIKIASTAPTHPTAIVADPRAVYYGTSTGEVWKVVK